AAERADLDWPIPACPDWRVRDLLCHLGGVHRWATAHVGQRRAAPMDKQEEDAVMGGWPDDDALVGWFREGYRSLVRTLETADPDFTYWSFLPAPSPLAFWARRQAHETAIHHADAESANGAQLDVDPALAVDGIDELLFGFYSRKRGRLVADPALALGIKLTDAQPADAWSIVVGPEARDVSRGSARGDCVITGTASDVYQFLWNRRHRRVVHIDGNPLVLDLWREKARIAWS